MENQLFDIDEEMCKQYYIPFLKLGEKGEIFVYLGWEKIGKVWNVDKVTFNFLKYYIQEVLPQSIAEGGYEDRQINQDLEALYWEWINEGLWDGRRDVII